MSAAAERGRAKVAMRRERVAALHREGCSAAQISARVGAGRSTVLRDLAVLGLARKRGGPRAGPLIRA